MPTDIIYLPGAGPAFTTETMHGGYTHRFPLGAREPTALEVEAAYVQTTANYSRPEDNTLLAYTTNGSTTNCYFINDEDFRPFAGHLGPISEWRRTWASVPASWTEPESYPYTYPSIVAGTMGTAYNVSAITASGANFILSSATVTGINTSDSVFVSVRYTRNSQTYQTSFWTPALAVTTNTSVTIGPSFTGSGAFSSVSGTVAKAAPARNTTKSLVVGSLVVHDYALTNTTSIETDLPLYDTFAPIITSTGVEVMALSTLTTPTASAYASLVSSGGMLVAECWRRRYLGNIYERATRYVPAL